MGQVQGLSPFIIYFACVCIWGDGGACATACEWKSADSWESILAFHQVRFKEGIRSHHVSMCQPRPFLVGKGKTPFTMAAQGALHSPPGPRSPALAPLCAAQGGATGVKPFDPNLSMPPLPLPQALRPSTSSAHPRLRPHHNPPHTPRCEVCRGKVLAHGPLRACPTLTSCSPRAPPSETGRT